MKTLAKKMVGIVGAAHVTQYGSVVRVAPANTEEVSAVARAAGEDGVVITPTGSGTKLSWGNPIQPQLLLSTHRMQKILEHTWQDLTVRAQAGCTWRSLQDTLQKHGQMVALDPLWPEQATIGGIAATNDSGALRLRYGALRDLVIGMTIVLADGTIARSGGKVVKNVAGYDLHKLMTGACGTLGIITEVNFRLHPLEHHTQSWSLMGEAARLGAALLQVLDSRMQVSGMQLVYLGMGLPARLDVRFAGQPDCLADQKAQLSAIAAGLAMETADEDAWLTREKIFTRAAHRDAMVMKATMLPSQVAAITGELSHCGAEVQSVAQARGLMTAALYGEGASLVRFVGELRSELAPRGGSVTALRMPQAMTGTLDAWSDAGPALPLMQRVKQELDAAGILNRGLYVGGI